MFALLGGAAVAAGAANAAAARAAIAAAPSRLEALLARRSIICLTSCQSLIRPCLAPPRFAEAPSGLTLRVSLFALPRGVKVTCDPRVGYAGRVAWLSVPRLRQLAAAAAAASLALSGCEVDTSSSGVERNALLAPDFVASTAANATDDPQAKWLLNQPKPVRESYVRVVIDGSGDRDLLATGWLLAQPDEVRASYVREVVTPQVTP
jgi:hypothetical protein